MRRGKKVRLVCSDIDGTVLGAPEAVTEFRRIWDGMSGDRPLLIYSTGRLLEDAKRVIREGGLPMPEYFIGGVGTMVEEVKDGKVLKEYSHVLDQNWDRRKVDELVRGIEGIEAQADEQQHEWKSSWFWHDAAEEDLDRLRSTLKEAGLEAQVIYSSARDLDVLPVTANKGNALRWICQRLGISLDEAVVCGDTGNDASMFLVPGVRGIAVGNAEPELLEAVRGTDAHLAKGKCAAGVIEGLKAFGVIEDTNISNS
ncbi:HAD-IIB family hydrolase [Haloferula chungangensis]|uniref:HAD-IIB family hydrolase n=1 Tax=Haloferula chungangensis TaxID=1048331 RepID=A0ABW2L2W2_9BACT